MTDEIKKLYYDIGEVSEMLKEKGHTIRYWCKEFGLEIKIGKNKYRKFTEDNIQDLHIIKYLLHTRLYTIAGAKRELIMVRSKEGIKQQ